MTRERGRFSTGLSAYPEEIMGEVTHYHVAFLFQDDVMVMPDTVRDLDDAVHWARSKAEAVAAQWNLTHPEGDPLRAVLEQTQKPGRGKTKRGIPGVTLYEWSVKVGDQTMTARVVPCDGDLDKYGKPIMGQEEILKVVERYIGDGIVIPEGINKNFPA
jgi:hypothetical protein